MEDVNSGTPLVNILKMSGAVPNGSTAEAMHAILDGVVYVNGKKIVDTRYRLTEGFYRIAFGKANNTVVQIVVSPSYDGEDSRCRVHVVRRGIVAPTTTGHSLIFGSDED